MIYINEAHAIDIWPIGLSAGVLNKKHNKIGDRNKCAIEMINEHYLDFPVYLDNMKNNVENELNCWPFKLFILKNKKFEYISIPKNSEYDIMELYEFLEKINIS